MILAGTDELGYLLSKDAELSGVGGGPPAADRLARASHLTFGGTAPTVATSSGL